MVDVTQIPYGLASSAIRGVYDSTMDGASDLADSALESAQNSLVISTQLLHNTFSSAYTEVVKIPDVIADLLFGPTSISSQARRILDPAWDAAGRVARGIWNALPDIPGIDVEQTVRSIASGIYTYIFGEDEVASVPETTAANNLISGAEELARKVVAKVDENTHTVRVARSNNTGSASSASLSEPVASTSLSSSSAPTTEAESGSSVVVIASIPPSTGEVASASAVASVAAGIPVVGNTPEGSSVINNAGGVEVSEGESSPSVFQTGLSFFTGPSNPCSTSNNLQSSAATAQAVGGLGVFGIGGNSGVASSAARSSATVVPAYNVLPSAVSRVFGDSGGPLTLGEAIYRVLTGAVDSSEVTSQIPTGLSTTRTLFYATVSRALGSNGNNTSSYQGVSLGNSIPQAVVAAGLNNIADISYVPYSGNVSSRISLGQSDPSSANLETGEVASNLTDGVYGLHFPTSANPDSGSQGGEQNAYETMRDLELAQSLNNSSLDGPSVVVDPSFLINQSRQVSVAV